MVPSLSGSTSGDCLSGKKPLLGGSKRTFRYPEDNDFGNNTKLTQYTGLIRALDGPESAPKNSRNDQNVKALLIKKRCNGSQHVRNAKWAWNHT